MKEEKAEEGASGVGEVVEEEEGGTTAAALAGSDGSRCTWGRRLHLAGRAQTP